MEYPHTSAANFSSMHGSTHEFRSSFGQLLTRDRVQYNRKEVLHKLLSDNSTHFSGDASTIDEILNVINTERRMDLEDIRDIAQEAEDSRKKGKKASRKITVDGQVRNVPLEEALYPLLTNIIDTIDKALSTRMGKGERKYYRQFLCTGYSPLISHDPTDSNAFRYKPDFSVVDRLKPAHGSAILKRPTSDKKDQSVEWRQLVSYLEVKSCVLDGPSPDQVPGNTALAQATDYARCLLVCLPFQLYVYGLLLCGSAFWLTWTDRAGVVLSPQYSLLDDAGLRTFIRIVLRLTWELSPYELGQDANTEYVEGHKSLGLRDYPGLRVRMGGPGDNGTWTTFGNPLWLSHTLFGRGTSVWRVLTDEGRPRILKVAWRTVNRTSELEIYQRMKEIIDDAQVTIPGIVNLDSIVGGDVHFKGTSLAIPMTVSTIRPRNTTSTNMLDMQLHRVTFDDVGKPLWKYQTPEQLVRAMRMVLVAHSDLCSLGILHRDISAGNILIRLTPVFEGGKFEGREKAIEKTEGFLTDFEFAVLPRSEAEGPKTAPGDDMTGTMAFMASSLLRQIQDVNSGDLVPPVSRTKEQDIESFGWVFIYAVYKNALENLEVKMKQDQRKNLKQEFDSLFPGRSAETVLKARLALHSTDARKHIIEYIEDHVTNPDPLCALFRCISTLLRNHMPKQAAPIDEVMWRTAMEQSGVLLGQLEPPAAPPLTHNSILSLLNVYLRFIGAEV